MSVEWKINGASMEALGLRLVSGEFRTQGASSMVLEAARDFDAAELMAFGSSAVLTRTEDGAGITFFRGKVASIPKSGSGDGEGHSYRIEDAWAALEETIYQEEWALGASSYLFPRFVFGIGPAAGGGFERINVGKQIENVIAYAAGVGVEIQAGDIPAGETPIPSEMTNMSCAEVIREALKLHPDWLPWLDHSTSPPTFHVTAAAALTARSIAVDGSARVEDFKVIERTDMLPESVRIVYEFATTIVDEVFRNAVIDKYPAAGPDGGPRVIQASIPLAGLQMQVQKSRVQTRTIPTSSTDTGIQQFIIANWPHLAGVDPDDIEVDSWSRELLSDGEPHPDPINPEATRITVSDVSDLPRQLVRGSLEDWMRRKVGLVRLTATIHAADGAPAETAAAIAKGTPAKVITATNADTKVYRGMTQWVAAEDVPVGVAQALYQAIHSGCRHEGSVTLVDEDVTATRYHGCKLNLTGGLAAWSSMGAPIHSVQFNIDSGRTVIGFGPAPHLAPQDFLEMQRILRARPATWWSVEERGSNRIGGDGKPSARGDTVGGYDGPENIFEPSGGSGGGVAGAFFTLLIQDGDTYLQGGTVTGGTGVETAANIKVVDSSTGPTHAEGHHMWIEATGDGVTEDGVLLPGFNLTAATIGYGATVPNNTLPTAAAATGKKCHIDLGVFTETSFSPSGAGNVEVTHCPGSYHVSRV